MLTANSDRKTRKTSRGSWIDHTVDQREHEMRDEFETQLNLYLGELRRDLEAWDRNARQILDKKLDDETRSPTLKDRVERTLLTSEKPLTAREIARISGLDTNAVRVALYAKQGEVFTKADDSRPARWTVASAIAGRVEHTKKGSRTLEDTKDVRE